MLVTLIALSLVSTKAETPVTNPGKLQCLNPVRVNPKSDSTTDTGTEKCLAVPAPSEKIPKIRK